MRLGVFAFTAGLAGCAGGAIVFLVLQLGTKAPPPPPPSTEVYVRARVNPERAVVPHVDTNTAIAAAPVASERTLGPSPEAHTQERDGDAENRELAVRRETFRVAYVAEQRDRPWATATERGLGDTLSKLSTKSGFSLIDLDCKTTMCKGSVHIADPKTVKGTVKAILHELYEPNCAIGVDVGDDVTNETTAELRFDCELSRINAVDKGR